MPDEQPLVLHVSRTKHLLEGVVESRSEPGRMLQPSILLQATILCPCNGGIMRDRCGHPKAVLDMLSRAELVQFILDGRHIPPPVAPPQV